MTTRNNDVSIRITGDTANIERVLRELHEYASRGLDVNVTGRQQPGQQARQAATPTAASNNAVSGALAGAGLGASGIPGPLGGALAGSGLLGGGIATAGIVAGGAALALFVSNVIKASESLGTIASTEFNLSLIHI